MLDNISNWDNISLEKYIEIIQLEKRENLGFFEKKLEHLIIVYDTDEFLDWSSKKIIEVYNKHKWLNSSINSDFKEDFLNYKFKSLIKLTLAEWIDLDKFIIDENYKNIIALTYRKYKYDEWGNIIYEPYIYNCTQRSEEFIDAPITIFYDAINKIIKYRDNILNSYKELFEVVEQNEDDFSEEEKEFLTPEEMKQIQQNIKKENERKQFVWQKLLDDICGGNWAYAEQILNLPATFVFNMMLMKKKFN
jgi:hypothetical protein